MNIVRKNKKGFTLIEIIVVLVILAILAAALIPSMIGFVNDARGKALVAEARSVYIAGQAIASEITAIGSGKGPNGTALNSDITYVALNNLLAPDIKVGGTASVDEGQPDYDIDKGVVKKMVYKKIAGGKTYTVTLESGKAAQVTTS